MNATATTKVAEHDDVGPAALGAFDDPEQQRSDANERQPGAPGVQRRGGVVA